MISLWHLLWIIPVSGSFGFVLCALLCAIPEQKAWKDEIVLEDTQAYDN